MPTRTSIAAVLFLIVGLFAAPRSLRAGPYPSAVRCTGLVLRPGAPAYRPGEVVEVVARGAAGGSAPTEIRLYYASRGADLTQTASWTQVSGVFDAGKAELKAALTVPSQPGEYVLVANVVGSAGETCSGNPGYACCPGGITVAPSIPTSLGKPCVGCQRVFVVAPPPQAPVSCTSVTLAPQKDVYGPGDTLKVTVVGAASDGAVAGIQVFVAKADGDLRAAGVWQELSGGTFDAGRREWSVTLDVEKDLLKLADPAIPGSVMGGAELVLSANVRSSSGKICSSNPAYAVAECPSGIAMGGGIGLTQKVPCNGCPRRLVVDPLLGKSGAYDAKRFWNLGAGHFWHYRGSNAYFNPPVPFEARVEVEAPTLVCGIPTLPLRYLKSHRAGYWGPEKPGDPFQGVRNLRFFSTGFLPNGRWSENYLGTVGHKTYRTDFLGGAGTAWYKLGSYYGGADPDQRSWDHLFYSAPFQHHYFPPYLLSSGPGEAGWLFQREDTLFGRGHTESEYCKEGYGAPLETLRGTHGWRVEHAVVARDYASAGLGRVNALRVKYVEYGAPYCKGWVLREDYYFAQDVGLVEVAVKTFDGAKGECTDADLNAVSMALPKLSMQAAGYYAGGAMNVTPAQATVRPTETVRLALPGRYVGLIEREVVTTFRDGRTTTVVETWPGVWVAAGEVSYVVPKDPSIATVRLRLRAPVPLTPSSFEQVMAETVAPWSSAVTLTVTTGTGPDGGPPRDLGGAGDGGGLVDLASHGDGSSRDGSSGKELGIPPGTDGAGSGDGQGSAASGGCCAVAGDGHAAGSALLVLALGLGHLVSRWRRTRVGHLVSRRALSASTPRR
ncbi:MAG: hypothetical protein IT371_10720 [Deltaproteobacteria bacterium]|nr:hypothetical protein [Deltaproteobacteria bacterium]